MIYCKSGKPINLKKRFDPFLFIQNDCLETIVRGIISGSLPLMCNANQDNDLGGILAKVIHFVQ